MFCFRVGAGSQSISSQWMQPTYFNARTIAAVFGLIAATLMVIEPRSAVAGTTTGTWTKLKTANPAGVSGTMLLLTDGTVIVQGGGVSSAWNKLTPDSIGGYVNGTWSAIKPMVLERLYFASNILPDGRVFVLGGEYTGHFGAQNLSNSGEIYDPVTNTWLQITYPLDAFGDDPSILLPNGKVLCGYPVDGQTNLFNPATNTFSPTGKKLKNDGSDEETWILLPNGNVLTYDVLTSPDQGPGSAQQYNPALGQWFDAGVVPVPLSGSEVGYELGPGTVLPNGKVLLLGATSNSGIYTPGTPGTWVQGPSLPVNTGADDAPGVMLADGHFIFLIDSAQPMDFQPPTQMLDYDYTTNSFSDITLSLPAALQNQFSQNPAFICRFLALPNGHVLFNDGSGTIWDYAPSTAPQAAWKPTITGIAQSSPTNTSLFTLTGTQLTGLWQGASFGDDVETDTNFPIVSIVGPLPSNTVKYAKTTNWTPGISNVGSTTKTSVQFAVPAGTANGNYNVFVSANGISSSAFAFTLPFVTTTTTSGGSNNYVTSTFDSVSKTLTLTGDVGANAITITERGGIVTVQGSGSTLISTVVGKVTTNSQQVSYTLNTSAVTIVCNFAQSATPATNDSISMLSVNSSSTQILFGSGADTATVTYSKVGTLTVDGGTHPKGKVNTLTITGSTITTKNITNIP